MRRNGLAPELYPIRDYLREIVTAEQIIKTTKSEIARLEDEARSLKGISYDGVRVQHQSTPQVEAQVVRLEEYRSRLLDIIDYSTKRREKVMETISKLTNPAQIRLLWQYYCDGDTWSEIAEDMGISDRHVMRLHVDALIEFGLTSGMLTKVELNRMRERERQRQKAAAQRR